jgi:hypothetical protein
MVGPGFRGLAVAPRGLVATPISAGFAFSSRSRKIFGFHDEAAAVGYLVFAVGAGAAFDLLEPAGRREGISRYFLMKGSL